MSKLRLLGQNIVVGREKLWHNRNTHLKYGSHVSKDSKVMVVSKVMMVKEVYTMHIKSHGKRH